MENRADLVEIEPSMILAFVFIKLSMKLSPFVGCCLNVPTSIFLKYFIMLIYLTGCNGGPYEKELLTDLLKNYNVQNRPVMNESSPIVITFGVTLQQIVDLVRTIELVYLSETILPMLYFSDLLMCTFTNPVVFLMIIFN